MPKPNQDAAETEPPALPSTLRDTLQAMASQLTGLTPAAPTLDAPTEPAPMAEQSLPPASPPPPPPPPPAPSPVRLNKAGVAALLAATNARCLYLSEKGYSLSGNGGQLHKTKVVDDLVKAGLLLFEPTGGRLGSVKITPAGRAELREYLS